MSPYNGAQTQYQNPMDVYNNTRQQYEQQFNQIQQSYVQPQPQYVPVQTQPLLQLDHMSIYNETKQHYDQQFAQQANSYAPMPTQQYTANPELQQVQTSNAMQESIGQASMNEQLRHDMAMSFLSRQPYQTTNSWGQPTKSWRF